MSSVPDPYYASAGAESDAAFDTVLDLLEDACQGLLEHIKKERGL